MIVVKRNDIRSALIEFYYGIIEEFGNESKFSRNKEVQRFIDGLQLIIKQRYRESHYKVQIRKSLKSEDRRLRSAALAALDENNRLNNGNLLRHIFGGLPLTRYLDARQSYDMVVEIEPGKIKAVVFAPSVEEDGIDWTLSARNEAEIRFKRTCVSVDVIGSFPEEEHGIEDPEDETGHDLSSTPYSTGQQKEDLRPKAIQDPSPAATAEATSKTNEVPEIGRILFSKKDQFNLRPDRRKDEISGYIYEQYIDSIQPLDVLTLEELQQRTRIFAEVIDIDINPISGGGYVRKFSEVGTHVRFHPLLEIAENYKGPVRPGDVGGFLVRRPDGAELREVLNIPELGIPFGWLDYNDKKEIFCYPLEPKDTIYQSVMIAGVQGKGKSNALRMLIMGLVAGQELPPHERPAVIILDGEGENKHFAKKAQMNESAREFLTSQGIGELNPSSYTVNDDSSRSNATLSMRGIEPEDIIHLMPELESKTENILRVLIDNVYKTLNEDGRRNVQSICARVNQEANNSGLIHFSQRPAIARAILSPSLKLLDQKDKIELLPDLLFKPGTVSIIDVQSLDQNKKRVVALYFLQMLSRFKMNAPNFDPGILLVVDEAEQLFPRNPSKSDSDYVKRIESKMEDITNRGRKRKYGIVLVTHLPSAVSDRVGNLANTKIAFGSSGANSWVRDNYGKEYLSEVVGLPTGICRINIKAQNERQGSINVRVRVPFI